MRPTAEIRIVDVPERSRFELYVGSELAGFTDYHSQRRPDYADLVAIS